MIERPKVGLSVIVVKDKKILIGKRKSSHGSGMWGFPGGHLEMNETWEDCVVRETFEETGIVIKNIRFLAATNDIFHADEKHYVTLFMLADYESGEVKVMEPEKCDGWEWLAWNDLPQPLFLPIENLRKQNIDPGTFYLDEIVEE